MRSCVAVALFMTLVSSPALAAKKGPKKAVKAAGPNMESTAADPATQEKSDEGPYKPTGKTGALAEEVKTEEEVQEVLKARPRDTHAIFGDFVLGWGRAPVPGPASEERNWSPDSFSVGAIIGGVLDVSPRLSLGLRIPYSIAAVDQVDGNTTKKETTSVFGSPELYGEYRYQLSELTTLPLLFGLGIPLAQGDPDPSAASYSARSQATVNRIADGASGWRDGELYQPKRVPIVLGVGIRREMRRLVLHAYTKFVVGINIGDAINKPDAFGSGNNPAIGSIKLNPVALRDVTLAGVRWDAVGKLWLGLDAWMVWNAVEGVRFVSTATPPSPLQFVAEPQLGLTFGRFRPVAGFIYPIGGRLRDSGIQSVHLHAEYAW